MLIYLLKATLVWGLSLVLFELLFHKLSSHGANRAYLLGSLASGFLMPLFSLKTPEALHRVLPSMHQEVFFTPATFSTTSSLPPPNAAMRTFPKVSLGFGDWLVLLWLTGTAVSLFMLARQARRLILLSRTGRPVKERGFVVLETGHAHGPFSFLTRVFVSSRDTYSPSEWRMVMAHEGCHVRQWHSLDVILLAALRAALWFHPMLYWYNRRLRMVHEYLADAAAGDEPLAYGHFLLEQSSLRSTPTLSLGFFHSPIKSRIYMLTQPPKASLSRYAAVLVLMPVLLLCCTDKASRITNPASGANTFEMSPSIQQIVTVPNSATGRIDTFPFTTLPSPVKMNGELIYDDDDLTKKPAFLGSAPDATTALFEILRPELQKLENGMYFLTPSQVVIDQNGRVVYIDGGDFFSSSKDPIMLTVGEEPFVVKNGLPHINLPLPPTSEQRERASMDDHTRRDILSAFNQAMLKNLRFSPGEIDGKPVLAHLQSAMPFGDGTLILVQNGVALLKRGAIPGLSKG